MAVKLTGQNFYGKTITIMVGGDLIYDSAWNLIVDPKTLKMGDMAYTHAKMPPILLTEDPEVV